MNYKILQSSFTFSCAFYGNEHEPSELQKWVEESIIGKEDIFMSRVITPLLESNSVRDVVSFRLKQIDMNSIKEFIQSSVEERTQVNCELLSPLKLA